MGDTTIDRACQFLEHVSSTLREKNAAYGDSCANPLRIFSQADPADGVRVRIDDKLSRIARGHAAGEDVILDLVGYLAILWAMTTAERCKPPGDVAPSEARK